MKLGISSIGLLGLMLLAPLGLSAQQSKASNDTITRLRADILLTEFNGDKKISSLPYTIYLESIPDRPGEESRLRMGVKVPILTGNSQINYMDVGTNIDCSSQTLGDGSFELRVQVQRSSIYVAEPGSDQDQGQDKQTATNRPITRNFSTDFILKLDDGQTAEGVSASDPQNGHVLKVTVTIHVVK